MKLVADLHIHSHFSRATSKDLTFEHLAKWAQLKGVHLVGTGDIAHPGWLQEMRENLDPAEPGLFRLREDLSAAVAQQVPPACRGPVRFLLAGEISNIYKKGDKTRKIHHVIFAPSLEAVEAIQARLERIGNIRSDGRPILGLPSRSLLEIILEVDPACHLIPAHIWTPWFALLGSKSGYDSVEECFEDLTPHIFALETGLSSDPPMNWRVSALDRYALVSNSDAHSPPKLAREATVFDTDLAYDAIFDALQTKDPARFLGTVEFFPEEGKYHFDGHRKCGISWHPETTLAHDGLCPVCGKPATVGVMHRVELLADEPEGRRPGSARPFTSLVPLPEVLSEVHGVGPNSKRVQEEYFRLLGYLGPELAVLQEAPVEEIAGVGGKRLAEAIARMRQGEVDAQPGYDGEYGVIRVLGQGSDAASPDQMDLFGNSVSPQKPGHSSQVIVRERRIAEGSLTLPEPNQGSEVVEEGPGAGKPQDDERQTAAQAVDHPGREAATGGWSGNPWDQATLFDSPRWTADSDRQVPQASEPVGGEGPELAPAQTLPPLDTLNSEQRAAALCVDTPLIIVAGPGTGKTRTLTARIAYLVMQRQIAPESVLAITFTNKATEEMAERLTGLLGAQLADRITIKTFHALGAMILREHAQEAGLDSGFVICSEEERLAWWRETMRDLGQREGKELLDLISTAKNRLLAPGAEGLARELDAGDDFALRYQAYEQMLQGRQALDFDDLILRAVRLLETAPAVLQELHERYHWISVDEYQDVNHAQYRMLRLLAGTDANLCVIGDPDQAIYGFRGADRRYFLSFQHDYPTARVFHLSQNYRSAQAILDAAMQVIAGGEREESSAAHLKALEIWSDFASQLKLDVYRAPTERAEAELVVHQIEQMVGGTSYFSLDSGRVSGEEGTADGDTARSFADFAVLYRLGAQSRALVEALDRSGIPYQVAADTDAYDQRADRVALMTLHAAKGLEFPVVFVVGCEEGLLPYERPGRPVDIEEERRLFYVGLTRAQQRLIMTHSGSRYLFGERMENNRSRFVDDIESTLLEVRQMARRRKQEPPDNVQLSLF